MARRMWLAAGLAIWITTGAAAQQLWTPDPLADVDRQTSGEFSRQPQPIRLVAPINGAASAQVVVRGGNPRAVASDLQGPGGAIIPRSGIQVRYAADRIERFGWSFSRFDALLDQPTGSAPQQAVWISVHVPQDARPGVYTGRLTISGVAVPVELSVGRYRLPAPRDYTMWAYVMHQPEALARTYGAAIWSDAHWRLVEQSLQLLAPLGNDVVQITTMRGTFFCDEHPMLMFRRRGAGWQPDWTAVDRFLDLYARHVGAPKVLWLELWQPQMNADERRNRPAATHVEAVEIAAGGRMQPAQVPVYGDGGAGDALWREVVTGLRQRVARRGWDPSIVMVGAGHDARPTDQIQAFFNSFRPRVQWTILSHFRGDPRRPTRDGEQWILSGGMDIGLAEAPYQPDTGALRQAEIAGGWNVPGPTYLGGYRAVIDPPDRPVVQYRGMPESMTGAGRRNYMGFTRIGLDGWGPSFGGGGWGNLFRNHPRHITAPGPLGPVTTIRYEMLLEGIQEGEARIALERAVLGGQLDQQKQTEIRQFLANRNRIRYSGERYQFIYPDDWQQQTLRLFDLAGEVQDQAPQAADPQTAPHRTPQPPL